MISLLVDSLLKDALIQIKKKSISKVEVHKRFLHEAGCVLKERQMSIEKFLELEYFKIKSIEGELRRVIVSAISYFNNKFEQIEKVQFLGADWHDNKVPILLSTNYGLYVVKYGDFTPWNILSRYFQKSTESINCDILIQDGETWGWYIRSWIEASNKGNPASQAYNMGYLCGISYYFNITDLHYENYIVTEKDVFPIDVECTLSHFDNSYLSFNEYFLGIFNKKLRADALNGRSVFRQYTEPYLDQGKILYAKHKTSTEHILRNDLGEVCRLKDYTSSFINGFQESIILLTNDKEINLVVRQGDWLTRKVFRPTWYYSVLLSESQLYGPIMQKECINKRLQLAGNISSYPRLYIENLESKQLNSGNVPIFHIGTFSGRVYSNYHCSKMVIRDTPINLWERKLKMLSSKQTESYLSRLMKGIKMD